MLPNSIKNNPVLTSSTGAAIITAISAFLLHFTAEQLSAVLALYAVIAVPATRSRVIATNRLEEQEEAATTEIPAICPLCKSPLPPTDPNTTE